MEEKKIEGIRLNSYDCEILTPLIDELILSKGDDEINKLRTKIRNYLLGCVTLNDKIATRTGILINDSCSFTCGIYTITIYVKEGGKSISNILITYNNNTITIFEIITKTHPNGVDK
jgi:hypothetical protein